MADINKFLDTYTKLEWVDGDGNDLNTPLSADNLNKLDRQIDGLTGKVNRLPQDIREEISKISKSDTVYAAHKYAAYNGTTNYTVKSIEGKFNEIELKIQQDEGSISVHKAANNPHNIGKVTVGLGNVDNTSDAEKPFNDKHREAVSNMLSTATFNKSQVGLDNVPNVTTNEQKPTYTVATESSELTSGETLSKALGKIAKIVQDFISHVSAKNNPHGVTKSQLGLSNVDNTSDADKPISNAVQKALENLGKSGQESSGHCAAHIANKNNPHETTKVHVGLANVDNTSDIDKPVSTLQAAAIADAKAAGTRAAGAIDAHIKDKNNPHGVNLSQLGVTATADKLNFTSDVTSAIQAQIDAKANANIIATTKYIGSSNSSTTYYKISGLGSFVNDASGDKYIELLISSRGGETIWCSLASDGQAKSLRLLNNDSFISSLQYSATNSAIYVTAKAYCHGISVHVLKNTNNSFVPILESVNSLPADLLNIKITPFGISDTGTHVGDTSKELRFEGSATRPRYNGGEVMLLNDMPGTEEWTFTLENGETVTKAVYIKNG